MSPFYLRQIGCRLTKALARRLLVWRLCECGRPGQPNMGDLPSTTQPAACRFRHPFHHPSSEPVPPNMDASFGKTPHTVELEDRAVGLQDAEGDSTR